MDLSGDPVLGSVSRNGGRLKGRIVEADCSYGFVHDLRVAGDASTGGGNVVMSGGT
jgi:hypothetical protein